MVFRGVEILGGVETLVGAGMLAGVGMLAGGVQRLAGGVGAVLGVAKVGVVGASSITISDSGGFLSPTWTMVLLKLHCDVTDATLSAFVAKVSGGSDDGSPTRLTEPPLLVPVASCLSSSDVEEAVQEEEPHFRLTVFGILQLSRYLIILSKQLICW